MKVTVHFTAVDAHKDLQSGETSHYFFSGFVAPFTRSAACYVVPSSVTLLITEGAHQSCRACCPGCTVLCCGAREGGRRWGEGGVHGRRSALQTETCAHSAAIKPRLWMTPGCERLPRNIVFCASIIVIYGHWKLVIDILMTCPTPLTVENTQ